MLLHHIISITILVVCLGLGVSGTEVVGTIFGSEITSIVLNIRWFIKHYNYYKHTVGIAIDILFFGLFLCVRLGVGGYLNYSVLMSDRSPFLIKLGGFLLYLVNQFFFFKIIRFLRYRLKKLKNSYKTENDQLKFVRNEICKNSSDKLALGKTKLH